jgi:hypothetical protein
MKKFQFFGTSGWSDYQTDSVDLDGSSEYLMDKTNQAVGIANTWTFAGWIKFGAAWDTQTNRMVDIRQSAGANNLMLFFQAGTYASDPYVAKIWDQNGSAFKEYRYQNFFAEDTWVHWCTTWDGSTLLTYKDSVLTAPDVKQTDNAGTMTDTSRGIGIGGYITDGSPSGDLDAIVHSTAIWNAVLDQNNVTAIFNGGAGGEFNLGSDSGNYTNSSNLQHWWRHGHDADDIGKDEGNAAALYDLMDDALNVSSADIVADVPS